MSLDCVGVDACPVDVTDKICEWLILPDTGGKVMNEYWNLLKLSTKRAISVRTWQVVDTMKIRELMKPESQKLNLI